MYPNRQIASVGLILLADADLENAASELSDSLETAPLRNLAAYATRLMKDTARERQTPKEEDAQLDRLVEILSEFPDDVARHVCETWYRRPAPEGVYTPKPAQIYHACLELTLPRRMVLQRIEEARRVT